MFEVKICATAEEKETAFKIREEVFVYEQGFALEIERDEYDCDAVHAVGYEDGIPAACGRLVMLDGKAKLGRIAVIKSKRNNKYGLIICEFFSHIAYL
jgi:predicted GNAT family N-acyltransferase